MADTLLESLAWSCNGFLLRIEDPLQVLLAVVLLPLGADTLLESLAWSCNGFLLRSEDSLQVLLAVVLLPLGADTLLESPAWSCNGLRFSKRTLLSISIQKQRKRPPFLKSWLADGWAGRRVGGQSQTSQTKCFRLVLKSKGNARHFWNYVWRTWASLVKYYERNKSLPDGWAGGRT